jgi:peptidoglycan/LPS O-acetylase OafA/YrhL
VRSEGSDMVYFPGLNGLRFIAAFAVIITHVELLKGQLGYPNCWTNPFVFNLGGLGVYFFFVLSGFLITYLLLKEKQRFGTVNVRNFYIRRILRIWPLYYFLIMLGFFVFPYIPYLRIDYLQQFLADGFWLKFCLNMFMLPNLALALFVAVPHIGQAWSIGVEEQFYLLWPWLVKRSGNFLRTLIILFVAIMVLKAAVLYLSLRNPGDRFWSVLKAFIAMSKIECMAIGGIGAYCLFERKERALKWIYNKYIQLSAVAFIPVLMYFTPERVQDGVHVLYSLLFMVIILNVASNPGTIFKLENRLLGFLGNISYGLYMYHMFIIVIVIKFTHGHFGNNRLVVQNILNYTLTLGLAVALSWLSFRFFERPISDQRRYFSGIPSRSAPKE